MNLKELKINTEKIIFLRNDDIRQNLDSELMKLTEICLANEVPITHAVEPANISNEVIDWLTKMKRENPQLIEIILHGYDHNVRKLYPHGQEFGGNRAYKNQLEDLKKSISIMNKYFGNNWNKVMSFPYGSYNNETLRAIETLGFEAITTSIGYKLKNKLKDQIGRAFKKQIILGKKVSYHSKIRKPFSFFDLGISVNIIKKYKGYDIATHYSLEEILKYVDIVSRNTDYIGILLHHRFHKNEILVIIDDLIKELKIRNYKFSTITRIVKNLGFENEK